MKKWEEESARLESCEMGATQGKVLTAEPRVRTWLSL